MASSAASSSSVVGPRFAKVLDKVGASSGASETATVAAGCFWSVELAYQRIPGVTKTQVGYTGGAVDSPSYEEVCSGRTGHAEAVQVEFDPAIVSYGEILDVLWEIHNPTTLNRQGNDVGTQYRSAIFYHSDEQLATATASKAAEEAKIGKPIVTEISPYTKFFPAEGYHQRYLQLKTGQSAFKGDKSDIRCYG